MSILQIETPRAYTPLLGPRRYKGARGGRGSGKSHFFAELLVERCLDTDVRAVCVREVQRSLDQSVKRTIEDKIVKLGAQHRFRVLNTHIEVGLTGRILFQGMQNHTAESIKSLEGYEVAWVEEAQSLSQRSLDLLYPTIRKEGSELWFSWNPNAEDDPVEKFFRDSADDPDFASVTVNYDSNPWFPAVMRADMERDKRRDPDKYQHIWLGQYQQRTEARVFHNWKIDEFITPGEEEEGERKQPPRFYYGADWGFSVDPTVLIRCYIDGRTLYVDREVYAVGCEIDRTPALFDRLDDGQARKWAITADSARPETIDYMKRHGYPKIIPAKKGTGSVEDGIEFLKNHDIIVHPRCKHTIDELSLYSYKIDKQTDEVLPVLDDRKNHVIDALRYAVESLRRAHVVVSRSLI